MRVLVVDDDDDDDLRALTSMSLEMSGHDALVAASAAEALAALDAENLDVVLLDLRMPVTDGWAVLDALRVHGRLPDLPVIVVSATPTRQACGGRWSSDAAVTWPSLTPATTS